MLLVLFHDHLFANRLFIISWFPMLEHLDDRPVAIDQRAEAVRLYKRPLLERLINKQPIQKLKKTISATLALTQRQHRSGGWNSSYI